MVWKLYLKQPVMTENLGRVIFIWWREEEKSKIERNVLLVCSQCWRDLPRVPQIPSGSAFVKGEMRNTLQCVQFALCSAVCRGVCTQLCRVCADVDRHGEHAVSEIQVRGHVLIVGCTLQVVTWNPAGSLHILGPFNIPGFRAPLLRC